MHKRLSVLLLLLSIFSLNAQSQRTPPARTQLIRGPYLQAATSNSIVIRWRTDVLNRSRVKYGFSEKALTSRVDDSSLVSEHVVKITGLAPATKYYYSIGDFRDSLQADAENYFYTLPVPGTIATYRVGVFGDCGNSSPNQLKVRDEFTKYLGNNYMNGWILLGDNAYNTGTDLEYQTKFFNIYKDNLLKKYPLYPSPGNHDYYDMSLSSRSVKNELPYFKNFTMPIDGEAGGVPSKNPGFYSFDIGNIHFISLDSYGRHEKTLMADTLGVQAQWLKKDLEAYGDKGWVVAYWHHPPYTMGSHNSDKENDLVRIRQNFIRILERYNVDLVLCGHSHVYERSKLMKGNFGMEAEFKEAEHNLSTSSALNNGSDNSCPYIKTSTNRTGTVYVVTGSAGSLGGKQETFPHDAMFYSNNTDGGAAMLEVTGNRLDFKLICSDGAIKDTFTMMKDVNKKSLLTVKKGQSITLTASYEGKYKWTNSNLATKSIVVSPTRKTTYTVQDDGGCVKDVFEVQVN